MEYNDSEIQTERDDLSRTILFDDDSGPNLIFMGDCVQTLSTSQSSRLLCFFWCLRVRHRSCRLRRAVTPSRRRVSSRVPRRVSWPTCEPFESLCERGCERILGTRDNWSSLETMRSQLWSETWVSVAVWLGDTEIETDLHFRTTTSFPSLLKRARRVPPIRNVWQVDYQPQQISNGLVSYASGARLAH